MATEFSQVWDFIPGGKRLWNFIPVEKALEFHPSGKGFGMARIRTKSSFPRYFDSRLFLSLHPARLAFHIPRIPGFLWDFTKEKMEKGTSSLDFKWFSCFQLALAFEFSWAGVFSLFPR